MNSLSPPKSPFRHRAVSEQRDALTNLRLVRDAARSWSETVPERQRQQAAWAFIKVAIDAYVSAPSVSAATLLTPPAIALAYLLDGSIASLARAVGQAAAEIDHEA